MIQNVSHSAFRSMTIMSAGFSLLLTQASFAAPVTAPMTAPMTVKPRVQHETVKVYGGGGTGPQSSATASGEDWKGHSDPAPFTLGAMTGLGVIDSTGGLALLGTASMTIMKQGFIPDINNPLSVEVELGPLFSAGSTAFWYSAHLRWDFVKDNDWTLYAIGGLAGSRTPDNLGNHFELFPRFGAGAMWNLYPNFALRGEISHEFMGLGVVFPL